MILCIETMGTRPAVGWIAARATRSIEVQTATLSARDDGRFASVEDRAVRSREGESVEFFAEGEEPPDDLFLGDGDFDGNRGGHGSHPCEGTGSPQFYPKVSRHHQRS